MFHSRVILGPRCGSASPVLYYGTRVEPTATVRPVPRASFCGSLLSFQSCAPTYSVIRASRTGHGYLAWLRSPQCTCRCAEAQAAIEFSVPAGYGEGFPQEISFPPPPLELGVTTHNASGIRAPYLAHNAERVDPLSQISPPPSTLRTPTLLRRPIPPLRQKGSVLIVGF